MRRIWVKTSKQLLRHGWISRRCSNSLRVFACRFPALVPPTIAAVAPAACFIPGASLHFSGSNRQSVRLLPIPLRFSNTVWRWTTLRIFRRAIFRKCAQATKSCTRPPFAIRALLPTVAPDVAEAMRPGHVLRFKPGAWHQKGSRSDRTPACCVRKSVLRTFQPVHRSHSSRRNPASGN